MYLITKVLNVNVITIQKNGKEVVAFGKGIGYKKKKGCYVCEKDISKVYFPIDNNKVEPFVKFLNDIPVKYIELAHEVINEIEKILNTELLPNTLYTLTDHIFFTEERVKKNMIISSSMYWEFKRFYPNEFKAAQKGTEIISRELGITLNEHEAASITFHIINGNSKSNLNANAVQMTKIVTNIIQSIQLVTNQEISFQSIHYERLIAHSKFFAERYLTDTMLSQDSNLIKTVSQLYPRSLDYAMRIKRTLEEIYKKEITDEEMAYLAIHINRILI